jgi:hypothetical protein
MTALLLALALLAGTPPVCDLPALQREEARLSATILAIPDGDPRLVPLFEEWDRATAATDACIIALGGLPPDPRG